MENPKQPHLDVCLSPEMLHLYDISDKVIVVIDIFRATSSICTALEHGAKEIIPVASVEETMQYKKNGYLVGGERHGKKLDGFDFGNSPLEFQQAPIEGKSLVLTTTNGTRAIQAAKEGHKIFIGSFLNFEALCQELLNQSHDVMLLCAGWRKRVNLEDTLFAGAVVNELEKHFRFHVDTALTTKLLYQCAKEQPLKVIQQGSHYKRLIKRGAEEDIPYCLSRNKTEVVPIWNGESLTREKVKTS